MAFTYRGLTADYQRHIVTSEEVDKNMHRLMEQNPRIAEVTDRPTELGDEIIQAPEGCLIAGRFTDDGFAIVLCDDPNEENLLYDYVVIIDAPGKALHTQRVLSLLPALLKYAVTQ